MSPQSARSRKMKRLLRLLAALIVFTFVVLFYWINALWKLFRRGGGSLAATPAAAPAGEGQLMDLLRQAYPEPPGREETRALLIYLSGRVAAERAVRAIAALTGRPVNELQAELGPEEAEATERVRQHLESYGFEDWLRRHP